MYSTLTYSPNEILTSAKMNQASDNDEALRDGTAFLNDIILNQHILAGEISYDKTDGSFGYEEIGRVTLGVAGDILNISSLPARKYLRVMIFVTATGGTLDTSFTLNNDTGSNYAHKYQIALNGTVTDQASAASVPMESGATASGGSSMMIIDLVNVSNREKFYVYEQHHATAGAANVPVVIHGKGHWVNTSVAIDRVTLTNGGTGDFAIGSEMIVLGKN
jgi:hypothetical protein